MPEMRDAVRDLFDKGHAFIRNDGLGIDTAWTHLPDDEDRESAIEWTASRVQVLADCCTAAAETQKRSILPEKLPWGWMLVFPISLPFLAIAASAWLPPQNHGQHIDELAAYLPLEILFVAVFAIPWLLVTCSVVKGRGNSLTAFIALLIFSLAGFFGASFPLILLANTTLDQGPPTEHNQWVVDFVSTESGLRADVLSWRPEKQIQQVRISEDVLAKDRLAFADCKMLTIETKPGFLGHEWISSVKPFSIDKRPHD
ncbi:hypothetical protein [Symmachiella dynata]|uniref:hypothetical protein n=1 Tax=Symmachiella dynata TaxID=2527995 RepID=UPI0030EDECC6